MPAAPWWRARDSRPTLAKTQTATTGKSLIADRDKKTVLNKSASRFFATSSPGRTCNFPPAAIALTLSSVAIYMALGHWRLLLLPLPLLLFWAVFRVMTPARGKPHRTIAGTPGAPQLLAWLAFILVLGGAAATVDYLLFGERLKDPLKPSHVALYLPVFVLLFGGVWVIERRYRQTEA